MNLVENNFSDYEKAIIAYQNHALEINECKNNGDKRISIDSYLHLLDRTIIWLRQIENCIQKYETKISNQTEQIDKLLEFVNKNN